ncbi:MAG: 3'-5' exonuclease [Cellulosilyticaceae bacterium]
MTVFEKDFETLNTNQQLAVQSTQGNHIVLAPAGTGKTKVIAMRTAYLMQQGVQPENILNLTFTNKAAKEMEARIKLYDPKAIAKLTIKTFHSFCYYLINHEKDNTHFTFPCTIMDESDTSEVLKRIVFALTKEDYTNMYMLTSFIENVKKHSLTFEAKERSDYKLVVSDYLKQHKKYDEIIKRYGVSILKMYQKYLKTNNSVDFIDLIIEATYLLEDERIASKWRNRYRYIQVDEMQDTSEREYHLLKILAQGNEIALFGDFNQTIYEWRGSKPFEMIEDYRKTFVPTQIELTYNYRSTQMLLKAANQYIRNTNLYPLDCSPQVLEIGEPIEVMSAAHEPGEMRAVAQSISQHLTNGETRIAVLTRINNQAKKISEVFEKHQIPCIRVEDIRLFRKKEIKDLLALFTYATNRRNSHALEKLLKYPMIKIDDWLLYELKKTQKDYMYLHDWFEAEDSDPYQALYKAYDHNEIIVLDVESTGLDTTTEDVIQIAAIRYGKKGVVDKLDVLLKPTKEVGDSYHVHGFSDEQLAKDGKPPKEALQALKTFVKKDVIVGHNIKYDLEILGSMMYRYDEDPLDYKAVYDTLDLSCKVYPHLVNHKLDTLSKLIDTEHEPNHNAYYDILATGEVLKHLMDVIATKKQERHEHLEAYYPYIHDYKTRILSMVDTILTQPPHESIQYVMNDCGLKDYYTEEEVGSIREYFKIAKELYDEKLSIQDNMIKLISFSALHYSEVEQSDLFKNKIPIMTIHQAKGLEFDYVYMIGCNEGIFPLTKSVKEGLLAEEKRLFYVGMTRAKKKLYLSYNNSKKMSYLIEEIGEDFKTYRQMSE